MSLASRSKVRLISASSRGTGVDGVGAARRPWRPWPRGWRGRSCPCPPARRTTGRGRPRGSRRSSARRPAPDAATIGSSDTIGSRSKDTSRKRRPMPVPMPPLSARRRTLLSATAGARLVALLVDDPGRAVAFTVGAEPFLGVDRSQHQPLPFCSGTGSPPRSRYMLLKRRKARLEGEGDLADRPVAVLGEDDVRLPEPLGLAVVVLLAVDEHDHVGVLLDLAALAQVGQHRHRRVARLHGP